MPSTRPGPAWDEISATHSVLTVNHDERYADDIINTNAMKSFFSRRRRFEATHHHISGTYLHRYANDAAWRENNRKIDDRRRTTTVMRAAMRLPQSRFFSGFWQCRSANHRDDILGDVFTSIRLTRERTKNHRWRRRPSAVKIQILEPGKQGDMLRLLQNMESARDYGQDVWTRSKASTIWRGRNTPLGASGTSGVKSGRHASIQRSSPES